MTMEVSSSPPLHKPGEVTARPKSILKNPSFSGPSGQNSPPQDDSNTLPPSTPLYPQESKDITMQNTIQNAGQRRSSSAAARRSSSSAVRRQSSNTSRLGDEDQEKMKLKWDEANLYLAEQESGGRMKITEPKTPYQYGGPMEEDDEDVAIDPRFMNVDEMDVVNNKSQKKQRESDIPGLDIGEAEDESVGTGTQNDRVRRESNLSRENSRDKHVSVSAASGEGMPEMVGMPTQEEQEKHDEFEARRKKHYEMRSVKGLLGHHEDFDQMDEEEDGQSPKSTKLPSRGINGS